MRLYFDYYGDFSKYSKEDLCFGAFEFETNGTHYIIDTLGEVDYDFDKDHICGRFKGEYEVLYPNEEISSEKLDELILDMDNNSFKFNLFDDGVEPEYEKREIEINVGEHTIRFARIKA